MVLRRNTKAEVVNLRLIGRLATALIEKDFVHALPTILLLRAHHRIEIAHLLNPKDKLLQKVHSHIFLEMELRDLEHIDTDPNFFQPSNLKWPFEFEFDDINIEKVRERLRRKKEPVVSKPRSGSSKAKKRFKSIEKEERIRRGSFRRRFTKDNRQEGFVGPRINYTHQVFLKVVKEVWDLQPLSGNIPIGVGPRPRKEFWFKAFTPERGEHENWLRFMSITLTNLYRFIVPPWAIQEWDIQLTVTNSGGSNTIEKRNFISTRIDPHFDVTEELSSADLIGLRPWNLSRFFNPFVTLSRTKKGNLRRGGVSHTVPQVGEDEEF